MIGAAPSWRLFIIVLALILLPCDLAFGDEIEGSASLKYEDENTDGDHNRSVTDNFNLRYLDNRLFRDKFDYNINLVFRKNDKQRMRTVSNSLNWKGLSYHLNLTARESQTFPVSGKGQSTSGLTGYYRLKKLRFPEITLTYGLMEYRNNPLSSGVSKRNEYFSSKIAHDFGDLQASWTHYENVTRDEVFTVVETSFVDVAGIAVDGLGNVYVTDRWLNRIFKFNSTGGLLAAWGNYGTQPGEFNSPEGIAIDSAGNIYVVDSGNDRIQKLNNGGAFISEWGTTGNGPEQFDQPYGITVYGSDVYITDTGNDRIQWFTTAGAYMGQWGASGSAAGQFNEPKGIAANASYVFVVDSSNSRIQRFNGSGTYQAEWGIFGTGDGQFISPAGLAIDSTDTLYIVDKGNNRIQTSTISGLYLAQWGSSGWDDGEFNSPAGVAVDSLGQIYVTDTLNRRVQVFTSTGTFSSSWSSTPSLIPPNVNKTTGDEIAFNYEKAFLNQMAIFSTNYKYYMRKTEAGLIKDSQFIDNLTAQLRMNVLPRLQITGQTRYAHSDTKIVTNDTHHSENTNSISLSAIPALNVNTKLSYIFSEKKEPGGTLDSSDRYSASIGSRFTRLATLNLSHSFEERDIEDAESTRTNSNGVTMGVVFFRGIKLNMGYNKSDKIRTDIKQGSYSEAINAAFYLKPYNSLFTEFGYSRQFTLATNELAPSEHTRHSRFHLRYSHNLFKKAKLDVRLEYYKQDNGVDEDRFNQIYRFSWQPAPRTTIRITHINTTDEPETARAFSQEIVYKLTQELTLYAGYQLGAGNNSFDFKQVVYLTLIQKF